MLVIKQNGRNKLGRTGGDIHTETDKNGHRPPYRLAGSSADSPSHPLCPPTPSLPVAPLRNPSAGGVAALREKGRRKRIHGKMSGDRGIASFPGPVSLQGDKPMWRVGCPPSLFLHHCGDWAKAAEP